MRQRRGTINHRFIKSRMCPGEWLLGRDVDIVDEYSDGGTMMTLCDVIIPATGRFERFRIPKDFIDYTDENQSTDIPIIDGEQVVHEGGLSKTRIRRS